VCKFVLRRPHNILIDVRVIKNVGGPSCQNIVIFFLYSHPTKTYDFLDGKFFLILIF